jgi:outer membrane protein assembly factor BamB
MSMRLFSKSIVVALAAGIFSTVVAERATAQSSAPPDLWTRKTGDDWPAFLGPTADGKSSEKGLIAPWPAEGPKLLWQRRVGVGYGMPAVVRGRLYQFDRYGANARLTCLNAETAEELWRFEYATDYEDQFGYDNGPRCCPVVDDDRVYLFGAEGMLHCLKTADGSLVWKRDTTAEYHVVQNFFGVGSTPIVEGELLIVAVGGSSEENAKESQGNLGLARGNGTTIVAFDKFTGAERYRLGDDLASYAVPKAATIGGRRWCFYFARGGLLAFDPTNGQRDFHFFWRAPILESVNASNPVVVNDEVFISETYGPGSALVRVKPGGYDAVWSDPVRSREKKMQTHWNTAIHVDGHLYGSSGRHTNNAELRCIEWSTGNVKWSEPGLTRSSLTYVDGHFICLTEYGDLLLLKVNPEKLDVVSKFSPTTADGVPDPTGLGPPRLLGYPAWAAPIVTHGLMYVRGHGRLACFEIIKP